MDVVVWPRGELLRYLREDVSTDSLLEAWVPRTDGMTRGSDQDVSIFGRLRGWVDGGRTYPFQVRGLAARAHPFLLLPPPPLLLLPLPLRACVLACLRATYQTPACAACCNLRAIATLHVLPSALDR